MGAQQDAYLLECCMAEAAEEVEARRVMNARMVVSGHTAAALVAPILVASAATACVN